MDVESTREVKETPAEEYLRTHSVAVCGNRRGAALAGLLNEFNRKSSLINVYQTFCDSRPSSGECPERDAAALLVDIETESREKIRALIKGEYERLGREA